MQQIMYHYYVIFLMVSLLLLAGCNKLPAKKDAILAVPLRPTFEQEVMLARVNYILSSQQLKNEERAELLYQRGVLYDSLGLINLASNDFAQVLMINPGMPGIFNYLGIYLTQAERYDAAYEAFDSVLELEPAYNYARLNRGIALYYGERYQLAWDDLQAYYNYDHNDPYRVLWLYFAASKLNAKDAMIALQHHYNLSNKSNWGWNIIEFYLGIISEPTLMDRLQVAAKDNTSLAEYLCETDFYLGKYYLDKEDRVTATVLFKLALSNNVHHFLESRYALLELTRLGQGQDNLSELNLE